MEEIQVEYSEAQWVLLRSLREEAMEMMRPLHDAHVESVVYGSIARGDVKPTSDIDIWLPSPPSPTMVQAILDRAGVKITHREIIQATPNSVPKAHIHLNTYTTVTFPLLPFSKSEEEFYRFSGLLSKKDTCTSKRVPGVNKKLLLIKPNRHGHTECSIIGREVEIQFNPVSSQFVRPAERGQGVGRSDCACPLVGDVEGVLCVQPQGRHSVLL